MLFVYNNESDLITQSSERNARANHQMRSWLKETVVCIESFARTQTRMDRLRRTTSRSEHVRSNRNLRRLRHQPEHGSPSRDHAHRRFGRSATLARTRWPVDKDGLPRRTTRTSGIGDLTLHDRQADGGPCRVNSHTSPIAMAALNATNLQLNCASIRKAAHRWETSWERACGYPAVCTSRRCRELLYGGYLATAKPHRAQNCRSSIGDQRGEGRVKALCTATHQ
jgi:hypothetical protein